MSYDNWKTTDPREAESEAPTYCVECCKYGDDCTCVSPLERAYQLYGILKRRYCGSGINGYGMHERWWFCSVVFNCAMNGGYQMAERERRDVAKRMDQMQARMAARDPHGYRAPVENGGRA